MNSTQVLHQQYLKQAGDLSKYDPDQPAEERRKVRRGYRDLQRRLDDNKSEFLRADNNGLLEIIQSSDQLYQNVKQTSDATLDSRLLVSATDLALKKVSNFVVGSSGVGLDVDEFVGKCISYMKNANAVPGRRGGRNEDGDDDDDDAMDWAAFGRAMSFKGNKRAPTKDFLLGPLSVQKKIRVVKARKMGLGRKKGEKAAQPTDVNASDIVDNEKETMRMVKQIYDLLKRTMEADDSIEFFSLFDVVVNPSSFGQTIENLFYLSFLVKEGKLAAFDDEETGLPMLALTEVATAEQVASGEAVRRQTIMSMTMWEWKQIVETFDIKQSIIPTREKENVTIGANGWYN
ncbi:Nse4 C-terminal-domain-containing protein [Pyronema domesticum]|nr:Nse4 C-terminal-domain-containing protein [Pyronema domesticum]